MSSYSILAILLLEIGLLCVVGSMPSNRRQWYYPRLLNSGSDLQGECVHIDHPCNVVFNRSEDEEYAKFPNTRGLSLEGSVLEFQDFVPLLIQEQPSCYLALWSLLCFHYFPQCHPNLPLKYVVTPCRETCEEARKGCVEFIETRNMSWPEHIECSKFNSSHADHLCINSTADPALALKVMLSPTTTTTPTQMTEPDTDPTSTSQSGSSTTTTTAPIATTHPPTTSPPQPPNQRCHSRCNYRTKATGRTFKRNNYTFAARVIIISSAMRNDSHHTYLAMVTQSWILDNATCSQYENHTYILIRTSYSHCEVCPSFNTSDGGNEYLIAGYCNSKGWYLPPTDSLVSLWHSNHKYQTKLGDWVQNGIEERQRNSQN